MKSVTCFPNSLTNIRLTTLCPEAWSNWRSFSRNNRKYTGVATSRRNIRLNDFKRKRSHRDRDWTIFAQPMILPVPPPTRIAVQGRASKYRVERRGYREWLDGLERVHIRKWGNLQSKSGHILGKVTSSRKRRNISIERAGRRFCAALGRNSDGSVLGCACETVYAQMSSYVLNIPPPAASLRSNHRRSRFSKQNWPHPLTFNRLASFNVVWQLEINALLISPQICVSCDCSSVEFAFILALIWLGLQLTMNESCRIGSLIGRNMSTVNKVD